MTPRPIVQQETGGFRKWQIYVALFSLVVTLGTMIFRVGSVDASTDLRMTRIEQDVKSLREEYIRKDVAEQRLSNIEAALTRIEREETVLADSVNRLLIEQKARR